MKPQDDLAEFFKEKFENFEPKVPSGAWKGIKSELHTNPPINSVELAKTGFSTLAKVSVALVSLTLLSVTAFLWVPYNKLPNKNSESAVTENVANIKNHTSLVHDANNDNSSTSEMTNKSEDLKPISQKIIAHSENKISQSNEYNSSASDVSSKQNEAEDKEGQEKNNIRNESNSFITGQSKESKNLDKEEVLKIEQHIPKIIAEQNSSDKHSFQFYGVEDLAQVKWQFGDETQSTQKSPTHRYEQPGEYVVTLLGITKDGKSVLDKAKVSIGQKKPLQTKSYTITIPNVFTPDGDGINDKFVIQHEHVAQAQLRIYNIAGQLVYASDNINKHWDGRGLNGERMKKATYFYVLNIVDFQQNSHIEKGYISIF